MMSTALALVYSIVIMALLVVLLACYMTFCDWLDEREQQKLIGPLNEMLRQPPVHKRAMTFEELYAEVAEGDKSWRDAA